MRGRYHDILALPSVCLILAFCVDPREFFVCLGYNAMPQFDTSIGRAQLTSIAPSQPHKRSVRAGV